MQTEKRTETGGKFDGVVYVIPYEGAPIPDGVKVSKGALLVDKEAYFWLLIMQWIDSIENLAERELVARLLFWHTGAVDELKKGYSSDLMDDVLDHTIPGHGEVLTRIDGQIVNAILDRELFEGFFLDAADELRRSTKTDSHKDIGPWTFIQHEKLLYSLRSKIEKLPPRDRPQAIVDFLRNCKHTERYIVHQLLSAAKKGHWRSLKPLPRYTFEEIQAIMGRRNSHGERVATNLVRNYSTLNPDYLPAGYDVAFEKCRSRLAELRDLYIKVDSHARQEQKPAEAGAQISAKPEKLGVIGRLARSIRGAQ